MLVTHAKIYGERNTGTNYLAKLLARNFTVEQLPGVVPVFVGNLQHLLPGREWLRDVYFQTTFRSNLGWKHSRADADWVKARYKRSVESVGFITITKNPYSWLISMDRKPYHYKGKTPDSLEELVRLPWRTCGRDNIGRPSCNAAELWNIKNRAYLDLAQQLPTVNLRYEDLITSPESAIDEVTEILGLKRISSKFQNYEESTKDTSKSFEYYRDYYLNEVWKQELTARASSYISSHLDAELMKAFNYAVL